METVDRTKGNTYKGNVLRHPQVNLRERVNKELGCLLRIYYHSTQAIRNRHIKGIKNFISNILPEYVLNWFFTWSHFTGQET